MRRIIFKIPRVVWLIVLAGLVLRFYKVWDMPPSLNWDEASLGYNAYSILQSGKDEWGVSWPLIFRAFGDYKLPVYIYTSTIPVLLFGLNAFAVRLPSVVAGTVSILLTYLVSRKIFKQNDISIVAALLMAISPWGLFLSRIALEANLALSLILGGILLFASTGKNFTRNLIFGSVLLGLSVWTYNSARIFVPLFLLAYVYIYRKIIIKTFPAKFLQLLLSLTVLAFFLLPMFIQLTNPEGSARYENVEILDVGAIAEINDRRQKAELLPFVERLLYNKATYFSENFISNYIGHFSPRFLFFSGGDNYQFNIPGYGLLYAISLPFMFYGVYNLLKSKKSKERNILILWLLLSPVAASVTRESPHTLRSIMMMTPYILITSYGLMALAQKYKEYRILPITIFIILISFVHYYSFYWTNYRYDHSFAWQYGYKEAVDFVYPISGQYEKIVFTKKYAEPHIFLLFYSKWNPTDYFNNQSLVRFNKSNWYWVDRIDKFYFVNDWDIPATSSRFKLESGDEFDCASCLLVTSQGNAPEGWKKIHQIDFLNGEVAFEIYEH